MAHFSDKSELLLGPRMESASHSSTIPVASGKPPAAGRGTLHLIIGPMFSGKSTELLRQIDRHRSIGKAALVVNHSLNCRYGSAGVTTHDARRHENCTVVTQLSELRPKAAPRGEDGTAAAAAARAYVEASTVFIEELQFYPDALTEVLRMVEVDGKTVVAAGLSADFDRRPFGDVLALMPYADHIKHLRGLCSRCRDGSPGVFTLRTTADKVQTVVAAADAYEVVCRRHYAAAISESFEDTTHALDADAAADAAMITKPTTMTARHCGYWMVWDYDLVYLPYRDFLGGFNRLGLLDDPDWNGGQEYFEPRLLKIFNECMWRKRVISFTTKPEDEKERWHFLVFELPLDFKGERVFVVCSENENGLQPYHLDGGVYTESELRNEFGPSSEPRRLEETQNKNNNIVPEAFQWHFQWD